MSGAAAAACMARVRSLVLLRWPVWLPVRDRPWAVLGAILVIWAAAEGHRWVYLDPPLAVWYLSWSVLLVMVGTTIVTCRVIELEYAARLERQLDELDLQYEERVAELMAEHARRMAELESVASIPPPMPPSDESGESVSSFEERSERLAG